MSDDPFRDDRAAALWRANALERENAALRRRLEEARVEAPPPVARHRRRRATLFTVVAGAVAFSCIAGMLTTTGSRGGSTAQATADERVHLLFHWTAESSHTRATLRGVWVHAGAAYAVGDRGTILSRAGVDAWVPQASGTTEALRAVGGIDEVYAVGDHGTVLRLTRESQTWSREAVPSTVNLNAVTAVSSGAGEITLVAGDHGTLLLRAHAGPWRSLACSTTRTLRAIAARNNAAVVVGDGGTVLQLTGLGTASPRCTAQTSNTNADLFGVASYGTGTVAVGTRGTLLHRPGDATSPWAREPVGTGADLYTATPAVITYEHRSNEGTESGTEWAFVVAGGAGWGAARVERGPASGEWMPLTAATATLRASASFASGGAIFVGDDGTIARTFE